MKEPLLNKKRATLLTLLLICILSWGGAFILYNPQKVEIKKQVGGIIYALMLPYRIAVLSREPEPQVIAIPIKGIRKSEISDTWGEPRSGGRVHEGVDIFAKRDTPVYAATRGYVMRVGTNGLGGNIVYTIGPGGVRFYYAHLERHADGIKAGDEVGVETIIGYVGTTGNATGTPPHLHFGIYKDGPQNPYSKFVGS